MSGDLYAGREQTLVKHFILRKYLERFAHIIGFHWCTITYVDCFSGPWKAQSEELKDTSFSIALEELRKAQTTHKGRGKSIRLRCMFLEKDPGAYSKLKEFAGKVADIEVQTRNGELASSIPEVLAFVQQGGPSSFPFIFIDPTGWTGFEMQLIAPLLRLRPGEVLINFMTDYIRRFIDHPEQATRDQFADLFGTADVEAHIKGLVDPREREDALLRAYAESVKRTGSFDFSCAAIILYPEIDRSYFHLIYATRSRKGVQVFKEVEKQAMAVMDQTRAEAKQRKRVMKTKQPELFGGALMPHSRPVDQLRNYYLQQARAKALELMQQRGRVPYEDVLDLALSYPLVWESDLKSWISNWKGEGLQIEGLKPRQRVPKLGANNILVWQSRGREGGRGE
jgi:three-Cys-motif partner protein